MTAQYFVLNKMHAKLCTFDLTDCSWIRPESHVFWIKKLLVVLLILQFSKIINNEC